MIFVSDMSDALSKAVKFRYLKKEIIDNVTSKDGRRHIWQWLTKQPNRMAMFALELKKKNIPWPPNLWAGTSLTTNVTTNVSRKRLKGLLAVSAKVRFLSLEPQIEEIDLAGHLSGIHWVIQGGESGSIHSKDKNKKARPFEVAWADKVRKQCKQAKVAYFMKQLGSDPRENTIQIGRKGKPPKILDSHGSNMAEWPKRLRVRDFPWP